MQLVETGDMELAWQAVDALGYLAGPAHGELLLVHGAVEEVTCLMQVGAICEKWRSVLAGQGSRGSVGALA